MARYAFECGLNHKWEEEGDSPGWPPKCPTCGGRGSVPGMSSGSRVYTKFDPDGEALAMDNKRDLDANIDKIRSGEWEIKERGPSEFRPKFERRFY